MSRKQSLKLALSFKETSRDLSIYKFLVEVIKDEIGISTYIKNLILDDMRKRDLKNTIYNVEKTTTFFLTQEGYVYIVYAYGNFDYTNEIDIVIF